VVKHSRELLETGGGDSAPLCTGVFEIIDSSDEIWSAVKLVPWADATPQAPLRVVYERAMPCVPSQPFVAFFELESEHSFGGIHRHQPSIQGFRIGGHAVRILPISGRSPFPDIPLGVLRRIAINACHSYQATGLAWLLSWALVCKAWLPLLDIFFESLGHAVLPSSDAATVARALEKAPEKGRLITVVNPLYFESLERDEEFGREGDLGDWGFPQFSQHHLKILSLAPNVKRFSVWSISPPIFSCLLRLLLDLRHMEEFTVCGGQLSSTLSEGPERRKYLNMTDIQRIIGRFSKLRRLEAMSWDNPEHHE
jgi:hypothetical protein